MINILAQRLDVCEKVISEKYEQQIQQLISTQDELKKELIETKQELRETKEQLKIKDEEFANYKEHISQRLNTHGKYNEKHTSDILNLSNTLAQCLNECERVIPERYEQQIRQLVDSQDELKGELKETKEQLETKDEELKTFKKSVSQRNDAFEIELTQTLKETQQEVKQLKEKLGKQTRQVV